MASGFQQLERAMTKIKQRRYRAEAWRKILGRFEESGLSASEFCARERISTQSLRRWRTRLEGEPSHVLAANAAQPASKAAQFIDLSDLPARDPRFEVRLELGGGVILSIARG